MSLLRGELDLSQISEVTFDSHLELRVAAVRDGKVLASNVVKAKKSTEAVSFQLNVDPPHLPGARLPCPVRIYVGPSIEDDAMFIAVAIPVQEVDFTQRGGEVRAIVREDTKIGRISVTEPVYARWLILCRKYTIHGRIVCRQWQYDPERQLWFFCDAPVPGAKIEVFDVDRFLWFFFRTLIGTAVTDIHGNFTLTFNWCCFRLLPWLRMFPMIDPEIYSKIHDTLTRAGVRLPPTPPELDPQFLQNFASELTLARGQNEPVPVGPGSSLSAEAFRELLPASSELATLRIWPWFEWTDCSPDIVFRATQVCGDQTRIIYNESNSQTRWNISTTLNVTLLANDSACCLPTCRDPECPECLKLQWIGCTPTSVIGDSSGPPDLRGYAYPASNLDRPFYGSLRIRGGVGWDVDYIKIQFSRDGGPWTDMPVPVFAGYTRSYWDGSTNQPVSFAPSLKSGQTVIMTRRHFEDLNPAIPRFGGFVNWNDYDTLFFFDTFDYALKSARIPDGLYQLRFLGYAADAADNLILTSERILPTCGQQSAETLYVRLDNQSQAPHIVPGIPCTPIHACIAEPDVYIRRICVNEGKPNEHCISACEIVTLNASDTLTIHFTASVPSTVQDGHLGGYWMRAEYGVSQVFYIGTGLHGTFQPDPTFEVGPDYATALLEGAPRPHWYGGDYKVTLTGTDFPECCAYLLHLRAWKRTTDGCTDPQWVHANEFELAFTVLRPELCPNTCPEQQNRLPG